VVKLMILIIRPSGCSSWPLVGRALCWLRSTRSEKPHPRKTGYVPTPAFCTKPVWELA